MSDLPIQRSQFPTILAIEEPQSGCILRRRADETASSLIGMYPKDFTPPQLAQLQRLRAAQKKSKVGDGVSTSEDHQEPTS